MNQPPPRRRSLLARLNPYAGLGVLPAQVWWLALATLINRAGTMVLPFLILYLTRSQGLPADRAAFVLMVYGAVSLLGANASGHLCDRFGAERVMVVSLTLSALTMLVYPLAHGMHAIVGATVLLSLFGEAFRPASMTVLPNLVEPSRRKQVFALNRLAVNLGMSVGPAAGGMLAGWWFPAIFVVDGVTALLAAALLAHVFQRSGRPGRKTTEEPVGERARGLPAWRNTPYLLFLLTTFMGAVVFFQLDGALPLHLVGDLGFSERAFGFLMTVNTVLIVLVEVPLNGWIAHWPHRRSLACGYLLIGAGFGSLIWFNDVPGLVAVFVIWTLGEMVLFPAQAAYVADLSPPGRQGQYMGLFATSFGLAFSVAPAMGVWVLEHFGSAPLWTGAWAVGATAALIVCWPRPQPPTPSPAP